jgi:hypothetical protein
MASLAPRGRHLCAPSNHRPRPHGHVARTTQSRHSQSMGHVFTIRRNVLSALREYLSPPRDAFRFCPLFSKELKLWRFMGSPPCDTTV